MTARIAAPTVTPYLVFSSGDAGTAPVARASGKYKLRKAGPLGIWIAELTTAGTANTTSQVRQNGNLLGTLTLGNAVTETTLDLSAVIGAVGDLVTVTITAVGAAALGLTILAPIA